MLKTIVIIKSWSSGTISTSTLKTWILGSKFLNRYVISVFIGSCNALSAFSNKYASTFEPSNELKNLSPSLVLIKFTTDFLIASSFLTTEMSLVTGCLRKDRLISLNSLVWLANGTLNIE